MPWQKLFLINFLLLMLASCASPPVINSRIGSKLPSTPVFWREDPTCMNGRAGGAAADIQAEDERVRAKAIELANGAPLTRAIVADACRHLYPGINKDFVALAMSGGGAKAAAFSGEAMFYLDAIGLLRKVDMVSSVSGSSFASSYYALSCDPNDAGCFGVSRNPILTRPTWRYDKAMPVLTSGFAPMLDEAIWNFFKPGQKVPVETTDFADFINERYFGVTSAPRTNQFQFRDLNPRRPALVLNATLLSDRRPSMEDARQTGFLRRRTADEYFHFAYTDYFFDRIGADLAVMPLAYGVASSGGFPVLIEYAVLNNYHLCGSDDQTCLLRNQLILTDGGANDNQGLIEVFTTLAELADMQSRSDLSRGIEAQVKWDGTYPDCPEMSFAPQQPSPPLEPMRGGDKALVLIVNSSITEATGVDTSRETDFLIGTLNRASAAIDAYSAVGYNLRKRLYQVDLEGLRCRLRKRGLTVAVTPLFIELMTLDRYTGGGVEVSLAEEAHVGDWLSRDNDELRRRQARAFAALKQTRLRENLALTPVHPQCLFEQSKLAEQGLTSLADIRPEKQPQLSGCLRHAARWAVALRAEEICQSGRATVLNDSSALGCTEDGHLKALSPDWQAQFASLPQCDLKHAKNSPEDNRSILHSLAQNSVFTRAMRDHREALMATLDNRNSPEEDARLLGAVCHIDNFVDDGVEATAMTGRWHSRNTDGTARK